MIGLSHYSQAQMEEAMRYVRWIALSFATPC